jgi:glycosyltransferase involved in cell wall biosynthesis
VVIPTTERPASLRRLLESLGRQTVPVEAYEVIVCMDGSSDRVRTMLDLFRLQRGDPGSTGGHRGAPGRRHDPGS